MKCSGLGRSEPSRAERVTWVAIRPEFGRAEATSHDINPLIVIFRDRIWQLFFLMVSSVAKVGGKDSVSEF